MMVAKGIWFVPTPYVAEYDAQWRAERAGTQPQESPGLEKIEENTVWLDDEAAMLMGCSRWL